MRKQLSILPFATVLTTATALAGIAGCSQASDAGSQCTDKACFFQRFSDCEAASYTTQKHAGSKARYRIWARAITNAAWQCNTPSIQIRHGWTNR